MKAPLHLEGFQDQVIEVHAPAFLSAPSLTIDGQRAPRGKGRNVYLLQRTDGGITTVRLKPSLVYDFPLIEVDGQLRPLVPPLKWYQYAIGLFPLLLIFGGLLGIALALIIFLVNIRVWRASIPSSAKYLLVLALSVGLPLLYYLVSFLLIVLMETT